ncbi:hypothetical protein [Halomonas sp. N3-2A]|uniref:hypothetical protein n=1 Tax=Halomonas sp. N3-2A TaxID=2014541 RepID=UPI000B5B13F0|nr:hypothetical protein [Halomonas sp. N3-2A]ASK18879.1 hypothetical protein CEK60_05995 [Halomonas sp. N3-2A]
MSIHESMNQWGKMRRYEGDAFKELIGVDPAEPDAEGIELVLEVLGDQEAHTITTIDAYLTLDGVDLSCCQIAACIHRLYMDGHNIKLLPPYDIFGCPERFKLIGKAEPLAGGAA